MHNFSMMHHLFVAPLLYDKLLLYDAPLLCVTPLLYDAPLL